MRAWYFPVKAKSKEEWELREHASRVCFRLGVFGSSCGETRRCPAIAWSAINADSRRRDCRREMFRVNVLRETRRGGSGIERKKETTQNAEYAPNLRVVFSPTTRFLLVLYFYPVSRTRDWELLKATKEDIRVYRVAAEGKYERANAQMEGRKESCPRSHSNPWQGKGRGRRRRRTDCYFCVSICCVLLRVRLLLPPFPSLLVLPSKAREKALKAPCVWASWTFCDIPFATLYSKEDCNVPSSLLPNFDERRHVVITLLKVRIFHPLSLSLSFSLSLVYFSFRFNRSLRIVSISFWKSERGGKWFKDFPRTRGK